MSAKHKPATPLPWHVEWGVNLVDEVGEEVLGKQIDAAAKNASYAAHASNAYPKLVSYLRERAKNLGNHSQAYRLLVELGEAP